jgi:hypothetical protein
MYCRKKQVRFLASPIYFGNAAAATAVLWRDHAISWLARIFRGFIATVAKRVTRSKASFPLKEFFKNHSKKIPSRRVSLICLGSHMAVTGPILIQEA